MWIEIIMFFVRTKDILVFKLSETLKESLPVGKSDT